MGERTTRSRVHYTYTYTFTSTPTIQTFTHTDIPDIPCHTSIHSLTEPLSLPLSPTNPCSRLSAPITLLFLFCSGSFYPRIYQARSRRQKQSSRRYVHPILPCSIRTLLSSLFSPLLTLHYSKLTVIMSSQNSVIILPNL